LCGYRSYTYRKKRKKGEENMKWLLGSNDTNMGLLELEDGTLIVKETTIGERGNVLFQSLKLLMPGKDRIKEGV